jgi:hypothetical protein
LVGELVVLLEGVSSALSGDGRIERGSDAFRSSGYTFEELKETKQKMASRHANNKMNKINNK